MIWALFRDEYEERPPTAGYKLFHILESMSYVRDRERRAGWFSRSYSKVMEREAKARRGA